MGSKAVVAIIVAVIVVSAGIGAGIYFAHKDAFPAEKVKPTVEAGDYIIAVEKEESGNTVNMTASDFLSQLYTDKTSESIETVEFKGKKYDCYKIVIDEEQTATTVWAVKGSGFILKKTIKTGNNTTDASVSDTNLNVTLPKDKQIGELKVGSAYMLNIVSDNGESATLLYNFLTYDDSRKSGSVSILSQIVGEQIKMTVIEVKGDKVILDNGKEMSITEFRSFVSIDDWKKLQKDIGADVKTKRMESKFMDTPFGKRVAIIETIEVVSKDESTSEYKFAYSMEGFIYTCEDNELFRNTTIIITDTSMKK